MSPYYLTFRNFFFLKSNIRPLKIFLKSNILCTKKSVAPAIFLKSRFFLKSGFLKSRVYCIINRYTRYCSVVIFIKPGKQSTKQTDTMSLLSLCIKCESGHNLIHERALKNLLLWLTMKLPSSRWRLAPQILLEEELGKYTLWQKLLFNY